jgi:hypothetical protein
VKLLLPVLFIVVPGCLFYAGMRLIVAARQERRLATPAGPREWEIREQSSGSSVSVKLIRAGQTPLQIGEPLALTDEDFDIKLHELRSEAQDKAIALNFKPARRQLFA